MHTYHVVVGDAPILVHNSNSPLCGMHGGDTGRPAESMLVEGPAPEKAHQMLEMVNNRPEGKGKGKIPGYNGNGGWGNNQGVLPADKYKEWDVNPISSLPTCSVAGAGDRSEVNGCSRLGESLGRASILRITTEPSSTSGDLLHGEALFDVTRKVGPWVVFAPTADQGVLDQLDELRASGGVVRHVDAREMTTPATLFREFAEKLSFPGYFGYNWDALVDCLDDLHGDWHAYRDVVIVVDHAELLLEKDFLPLFVSVLCQAAEKANLNLDEDGEPFNRPAVALHFVLEVPAGLVRTPDGLRGSVRHVTPYVAVG